MGATERHNPPLLLLLLLLLLPGLMVCAGGAADDAMALLDFRSGLDGSAGKLGGWNATSTWPCDWAGVGCDGAGNVVRLRLNASGLRGPVSESLGRIANLEELDLSNNMLSGPIPSSIGNLTRLAYLAAGSNNLSQSIPDGLGISGSLTHVDLGFNQISGPIPAAICQSSGLKVLTLTNNTLTGGLPPNVSNWRSLERLFLGTNLLKGEIPAAVGELESLVSLDVSYNGFTGEIPATFAQPNLTYLNLGSNSLVGTIPEGLGKLGALRGLLLNDNRLSGPIPRSLGELRSLEELELSGNLLSDEIPVELGNLTRLTTLKLMRNRLSGAIPSSLDGCALLLDLNFAQNNLSQHIPPAIGSIPHLTYGLNLSFNSLSGPIPRELGRLQNLFALDLSHNSLDGNVPQSLGDLPSLLVIDLSFNPGLNGSLPNFRLTVANASDFEGNPALCGAPLAACPGSRSRAGGRHRNLRVWVAVLVGFGIALALIALGILAICYWRVRYGYAQTGAEPKAPSAEGRLFMDDKPAAFTFDELVEATRMISLLAPVGKGRFSTVYKVVMPGGQQVAVKKLKVDVENCSVTRKFTSELQKIDKMQHRNLLTLLGYVLQGDSLLLVYDFCTNGSLGEWLHRKPEAVLEWSTRYRIALGGAQGLAFLHHNVHPPFIHRDVNSNNILLDESFEPLLGDVGLAKLYDPSKETESMTDVAGSFGYICPEYAYTMRVTEKSNVYSFGVILLEILLRKRPVEPSFGEGCDLVSWVHSAAQRNETPEQLLDASISTASFSVRQEMLRVLRVAKLCTSTVPSDRPRMKVVLEMLNKAKSGYYAHVPAFEE